MKLSTATHQLEEFPEWLNIDTLRDLLSINNETNLKELRYEYTVEIMKQLKKSVYNNLSTIVLPNFGDGLSMDDIMVIGRELNKIFDGLYINVHYGYESDKLKLIKFSDYESELYDFPVNFIIEFKCNFPTQYK